MQRIYAVTKGEQGTIDVGSLDHSDSTIVSFRRAFRARKVNKRQLSDADLCVDTLAFRLVGGLDLKDGMRAT